MEQNILGAYPLSSKSIESPLSYEARLALESLAQKSACPIS
jgi:hypothetical protein